MAATWVDFKQVNSYVVLVLVWTVSKQVADLVTERLFELSGRYADDLGPSSLWKSSFPQEIDERSPTGFLPRAPSGGSGESQLASHQIPGTSSFVLAMYAAYSSPN